MKQRLPIFLAGALALLSNIAAAHPGHFAFDAATPPHPGHEIEFALLLLSVLSVAGFGLHRWLAPRR